MKYLFLLYADESQMPAPGSPEMNQQFAAYGAFYDEAAAAGVFSAGDPILGSSSAKTVRTRGGSVDSHAGPFSAGGDQVIGFYVLDVASEEDAITYASKIPAASVGAVEVRPIMQM